MMITRRCSESACIRQVANALWEGHTVEDWTECAQTYR